MNMNVLTNLKFQGSSPILEHLTEFPENPFDGHMTLIGGVVYIYTTLKGMSTWYPLTNEKNYFVQTQGLASTSWQVNHNLNTSDFVFFVYDENNNLIQPDYEYVNDDSFKLNFTVARKGKVIVFYAVDALNIDKSYGIKKLNYVAAQDQTVFTITDSLFVFDYIDVYVNGIKINDTEYSYTTDTITLNSNLNADDYVSVTTYGQVDFREIGVRKEEYTAVQDQTVFNIVHLESQVDVFVNGIILKTTEFSDDANTVTIGSPLNEGDEVILKVYDTVNSLDNYTQIEVDQKVNTDDIVDALDSTYTAKPLSANMGRVLKSFVETEDTLKVNITDIVDDVISTDTLKPLSANQGKYLSDKIDSEITDIDTLKVNIVDIVDDVISTDTLKPLSANQGKVLKEFIDEINVLLTSDDTTLDELQEVVDYIKQNKTDLETLTTSNIAGLDDDLAAMQTGINTKASQEDMDALATADINGLQTTLNNMDTTINTKASQEDMDALSTADINGLQTTLNNMDAITSNKIEANDYATPTVGGTIKLRRDGDTLYITTDGSDA